MGNKKRKKNIKIKILKIMRKIFIREKNLIIKKKIRKLKRWNLRKSVN
ncbi:hypothetical protein [Leptotrichia hofstadii]|uniref:Uncharacterized protein n=1 Tax=Leptotrichia hofstadii F0254 TaxID=634994 RepID=C9N0U2_9FUSO|nr:hypothetical protein [Leptotrichia hofstadii]EEX73779.1 hypothetical protein GCWU000323_02458 [Leptotrichia hofstadii F0254]